MKKIAAPGNLTTPRGNRTLYAYSRNDETVEQPDDSQWREEATLDGVDSLVGLGQAAINNYWNADFWAYLGTVLTHNPITDQFGISRGDYVL